MGPNPTTEGDYINNYAGFWNAVYEADGTIFPESVRKTIQEDCEMPDHAHATALGMVLQRLQSSSLHPGLHDLGEDIMRVYHGMGLPEKIKF